LLAPPVSFQPPPGWLGPVPPSVPPPGPEVGAHSCVVVSHRLFGHCASELHWTHWPRIESLDASQTSGLAQSASLLHATHVYVASSQVGVAPVHPFV
jgi:hypothetical protein